MLRHRTFATIASTAVLAFTPLFASTVVSPASAATFCKSKTDRIIGGTVYSLPTATPGGSSNCWMVSSSSPYAGVLQLQRSLNACYSGIDLLEDGVMGAKSRAAVKDIQGREGIVQDGQYGPQTRDYMKHLPGCLSIKN